MYNFPRSVLSCFSRALLCAALALAASMAAFGDDAKECDRLTYGFTAFSQPAALSCQRAAEQGDAGAQYWLGKMYFWGFSETARDYKKAVKWYHKAAEQGHADAQYQIGTKYRPVYSYPEADVRREWTERNPHKAIKWYRLAAEQGHADAQASLARVYDNGMGVRENNREAVKWYRRAAAQGDAGAQNALGAMYADGEGVFQDYREAFIWFSIVAVNGGIYTDYAIKNRNRVESKLSADERRSATAEAKKRLAKIEARLYNAE